MYDIVAVDLSVYELSSPVQELAIQFIYWTVVLLHPKQREWSIYELKNREKYIVRVVYARLVYNNQLQLLILITTTKVAIVAFIIALRIP